MKRQTLSSFALVLVMVLIIAMMLVAAVNPVFAHWLVSQP